MSKELASVLVRTVVGIVVFLIVLCVAAITVGFLAAHGSLDKDQAIIWLFCAVAVVAMTGAMVITVAWMRSIDEAAREAHKAAWFWGGCSGMSLGGVALIMSSLSQSAQWSIPTLDGRTDPAAYAAAGGFGMMLVMVLGYTVVWVWWWLARTRT